MGELSDDARKPAERGGSGISEVEIHDWTCFSCGGVLTQAHEGDYFHADPDSECTEAIPVPTSLVGMRSMGEGSES